MKEIELSGKRFPVLFSVNVVEQVQKRYGNVSCLSEKLSDYAEIKWVLAQTINAGIEYHAYMDNSPARCLTPDDVGAIMEMKDFQAAVDTIVEALEESLGTPKNAIAGEVSKIAANLTVQKATIS